MNRLPCGRPSRLLFAALLATGLGFGLDLGLGMGLSATAAEQPMPSPMPAATAASAMVAPPAAPTGPLRPLPESLGGWRFNGEIDHREWVMRLTPGEAASTHGLQIAFNSAISVAPEGSTFQLMVNGRPVGQQSLAGARSAGLLRYELPAGTLKPGANSIEIEARQRHRVDCSVNATYELWSEIDPARSGLIVAARGPELRTPTDLAALWPNERGELRLTLVLPDDAGSDVLEPAIAAANAIALMNASLHPIVDVARVGGQGPGLDILVGSPARIASVTDVPGIAAGEIRLLPAAADGRARIALTATTPAEFASILNQLKATAEMAARLGSRDAIAAQQRIGGLALDPGKLVSLADFGMKSADFSGRRFQATLYARMPADFYVADTGKIQLTLDGGYAAHLDSDSRLGFSVNGHTVATLPLSNAEGAILTGTVVTLPLGAFRPGLNRIDIAAIVGSGSDALCDTTARGAGTSRFLLLADSGLATPDLPRIGRFPDLAATAAGGLFPATRALDVAIHVPHPDEDSLSAAATFAARLSVAAGRVVAAPIRFEPPTADRTSAIVIAASPDLSNGALAAFRLAPSELRAAWSNPSNPPALADLSGDRARVTTLDRRIAALSSRDHAGASSDAAIRTGSIRPQPPAPQADTTPDGSASERQLESWRNKFIGDRGTDVTTSLARLFSSATDLIGWNMRRSDELHPTPAMSLIVTQVPSPDRSRSWTLVTAPSSHALRFGMEDMTAPARWQQLAGSAAAYQETDDSIVSANGGDEIFIPTQPLSFGNSRLVVAGWLSRNPLVFGFVLLLGCLLTGAVSAIGLRKLGQRA